MTEAVLEVSAFLPGRQSQGLTTVLLCWERWLHFELLSSLSSVSAAYIGTVRILFLVKGWK